MGVGEEKKQNLEAQALGENAHLMFPWGKCVLTGGYCGPKTNQKMLPVVLVKDLVRTGGHKVIHHCSSHPDLVA